MWYGGYLLFGVLILFSSIPLFFFPPSMGKPKKKAKGTKSLNFKGKYLNKIVYIFYC